MLRARAQRAEVQAVLREERSCNETAGAAIGPFSLRAGQLWWPKPWVYAIYPLLQGNWSGCVDRTFLPGEMRKIARSHRGGTFSRGRSSLGRGGTPREFALSLRHEGYKAVSDFRIVSQAE